MSQLPFEQPNDSLYVLQTKGFQIELFLRERGYPNDYYVWTLDIRWGGWECRYDLGRGVIGRPPLKRAQELLLELGALIPKLGDELLNLGAQDKLGVSALKRVASEEIFGQTENCPT